MPLTPPQSDAISPKNVTGAAEAAESLPSDAPTEASSSAADASGGAPVDTPPLETPVETQAAGDGPDLNRELLSTFLACSEVDLSDLQNREGMPGPPETNGTHAAPSTEQINDMKPAAMEQSASGDFAGFREAAVEDPFAQIAPQQAVDAVPEPAAEDEFAQIAQQSAVDAAPENPFAEIALQQVVNAQPEQAADDPFAQVAPQQAVVAAPGQEAWHAQAPSEDAAASQILLSQVDTGAVFGVSAASEFDTVEPAVFAPTVDVHVANDFGAAVAGFVELPSPQLNTSALFGGSVAPASDDFFSTLVPPVDAPAQQQAQDPFAQTDVQNQQHHDSVWTPAYVQQNEAYVQEQTPSVLPPNDLFGAASAAQQDPFAQPAQHWNMQENKTTIMHAQAADASALFGGASARVDDAFAQVAAAQGGAAAFDPLQTYQQPESHVPDVNGLFGGHEVQDASSLFGAAPVAAATDGGDVSNLFGPPTAMPDIFGAPSSSDPFGGVGVNQEASFFDSLASIPAPVSQAVQPQPQQQQYAHEQTAYQHVEQNVDHSASQNTPAWQAQGYVQTPAQDNHYAQQYGHAQDDGPGQNLDQAQDYNHTFSQSYTQPGPFDGHTGGDDPFAQIAQQQQYQHEALSMAGYPGAVPQQDSSYAQPYYEQPATEAEAHQYETQAQQYAQQAMQYLQEVPPDVSTQQQLHSSSQRPDQQLAEMLQQGVQAAFAQGAFQQPDDDTDSVQQAASDVLQPDDLPFPWQAHVDPGSGCIYYFNTQTGGSSWEPPVREDGGSEAPPQEWLNETSTQQTLQANEPHYAYQEQQQHEQQPAQEQQQQQAQYLGQADQGAYNYGQPDQGAYNYGQPDQGAYNYGQAAQGAYNYGQANPGAYNYGQPDQGAYNDGQAQGTNYSQQAVAHDYGQAGPSTHQQAPTQGVYPAMGEQNTGVQQAHVYSQQYNAGYADVMQQQYQPQPQQQQQPMATGGLGGYTGNIMMPTNFGSAQNYGSAPADNYSMQQPYAQAMHGDPQPMHGGGMQGGVASRRPPCAVMCFGMGGQLVVAMPGARRSLGVFTGNAQELDMNRPLPPPPVSVYKMQTMPSQAALFRQLEAFPGPLSSTAASKKAVKAYIEEQIQNPNYSEEDLSVNPGTMRLLWEVLGTMIDCNGDLSAVGETSKITGTERIVALLKDPNFSGDQFLNSGGGVGGFNAIGLAGMGMAGGVMDPANRLMPAAQVNDVQVQQALQDMQELLLNGKREEACQKALENELWAPALLLSSYMNIDMYQKVMGEFARRSFKVGTPLRTLYMQFAGQGKHLFDMDTLEPLLDAWQANLSMLLNNRTPGDADVLVNIGEGLWKLRKDVEAAHVCMMLAGEEIQAADAPTCRMALIGADHRANPASFCTAAALQRTEIWEFAVKLKTPKKEMPVAMTYKLHYAMMLAEFGSKEKALAYVEALSVAMQGSARVPPRLQAEIEMFEHRLRLYIGGKTAAASSAFKGSFFGGLKKVLDTAVSSAIYGTSSGAVPGGIQATAKAPAIAPAPPAQAPSEKVKAIQAAAAEKERQAKLKAQQELEKKREAEEKKRAENEAKQAAKKKAKEGGDRKDGEEEKKGMFGKIWGAISGEKQVDLGEENSFYFNEKLQRWVEKGKEHEVCALCIYHVCCCCAREQRVL